MGDAGARTKITDCRRFLRQRRPLLAARFCNKCFDIASTHLLHFSDEDGAIITFDYDSLYRFMNFSGAGRSFGIASSRPRQVGHNMLAQGGAAEAL